MPGTTAAAPPLTPADIHLAVDWFGRDVIVVPDEIARRMEREREDGWHEFIGHAAGESRLFPAGTWMYEAITTLMDAYAASPIPDGLNDPDTNRAAGDRNVAGKRWHLWPSIVGESDWDDTTQAWRDYPNNTDLHVFGSASIHHSEDAYQITG